MPSRCWCYRANIHSLCMLYYSKENPQAFICVGFFLWEQRINTSSSIKREWSQCWWCVCLCANVSFSQRGHFMTADMTWVWSAALVLQLNYNFSNFFIMFSYWIKVMRCAVCHWSMRNVSLKDLMFYSCMLGFKVQSQSKFICIWKIQVSKTQWSPNNQTSQ